MYESPKIINSIGKLLRKPLPRAAEDLDTYMIELDAARPELAEAVVDCMRLLHEKRKQLLWPKDAEKGLTELDRQTRLDGDIAPIERDYQFLLKLERLVEHRINLAVIIRSR